VAGATPLFISGAVEGLVDEAVLRRLIRDAGATLGAVYGKNGKANLRRNLRGYNRAARWSPWMVLVDLDRDADCAPPLVTSWLPAPARHMRFRVAVRAVEAWLLADRERMASFLRVPQARVPREPESVEHPKRAMVDLARRSRRREIREDMVPRPGSGRAVGPAYTSRLIEFAYTDWRVDVAARNSDSLRRCRERLSELVRERG
jgi:hypothetical protein